MREYRKYSLALLLVLGGIIALFIGKMDGGTYVALATLILSVYGAANVADKHVKAKAAANANLSS